MGRLDFNFNDVPDRIAPITPDIYELEVATVPEVKPAKSGNGQNMIIDFRVSSEGDFKGRSIRDYIFLNDMGLVKAKQLLKSAGVAISTSGINTEDLLGARVKAVVVANVFKDANTGEDVEGAKISKYIFTN